LEFLSPRIGYLDYRFAASSKKRLNKLNNLTIDGFSVRFSMEATENPAY
jgi:hypothetical protein